MNDLKKSRVFLLLSGMFNKEIALFEQSSIYHDQRISTHIINLYKYFKSAIISKKSISLEKDVVHRSIFGQLEYSESRLNKLMGDLHELLEDFLAQYMTQSEFQKNLSLAKYYREKNNEIRFNTFIQKLEKYQNEYPVRDKLYYLNDFLILNEKFGETLLFDTNLEKINNLPKVVESLDTFYTVLKLEFIGLLLLESHIVRADISNATFISDELLKLIPNHKIGKIPLIDLYHKAIRLMKDNLDDENFVLSIFYSLLENKSNLPESQYKDIHTYIRTYCSIRYNEGKEEYLAILFKIQKIQLDSEILLTDGKINALTLVGLTEVAFKLQEYDWAKYCIEKYKDKIISSNSKDELYQFNMANYYFNTNEFSKAADTLFNLNSYDNVFIALSAKRLEIKIYYELKELNLLDSRLESFKIWLHRKSKNILSTSLFENNNAFVNMIKQMIFLDINSNDKNKLKLLKKINEKRGIADREWLRQKLG